VSKLSDADGELQETSHWLATALACGYIAAPPQFDFQSRIDHVGKMLGKMMLKPESFVPKR
jgi:four helix bundle protein